MHDVRTPSSYTNHQQINKTVKPVKNCKKTDCVKRTTTPLSHANPQLEGFTFAVVSVFGSSSWKQPVLR